MIMHMYLTRCRTSVDNKATENKHKHIITNLLAAHSQSGYDNVAYLWASGKQLRLTLSHLGIF